MRSLLCLRYVSLLWAVLTVACIPALPRGAARAPNTTVPASFAGTSEANNSAQVGWREFFTDPKLVALIDLALKNNQEINIVALEIDIAQNEIMARRGEFLPKVGLRVGGGIDKVSQYSSQGTSDDVNGVSANLANFALGFTASWEIDVWAKLRNATKAATLRYLATQEGKNFAVTRLVGELASSYYELVALDAQLDVLNQNIEIQRNALLVVRLQKEAARVTELAVKRFEAEVLKNQSRKYIIAQQIIEAENRINFLVGRFPQPVERSAGRFADTLPPIVHVGIPSQLLENRPDVKQAQLSLAAAGLDFRVAKAGFYPSLGISATIGIQSFDFLKLVSLPASLVYGLAADIMAPLINRRAITASYFTANSKQMQAVLQFERAILSGFIEVVKLLSMIDNLGKSFDLQAQQVLKLSQSVDISSKLFASARADYMEVLLTRRDALEAQMELIESKRRQMTAAVALYQALGGGWK
jgi:NodT family efflux transporter outer membrane factor (OMF) lipoprotein